MLFNEVRRGLESVVFERLRVDTNNYFEAVVSKNELAKLTAVLESFFGQPAWPSENKLSLQVQEAINTFGGIKAGQTLYIGNLESEILFAMLWPWEDGWHTTVKLIQK